jgi:hypothetical protein
MQKIIEEMKNLETKITALNIERNSYDIETADYDEIDTLIYCCEVEMATLNDVLWDRYEIGV